jgi:hypothetical protein
MPPGMLCAPWGAAARPPPPLLLPPVLPPAAVCRADVPLLLLLPLLELPELLNPAPLLLWSKVEEVKELVSAARELDPMLPALNWKQKNDDIKNRCCRGAIQGRIKNSKEKHKGHLLYFPFDWNVIYYTQSIL